MSKTIVEQLAEFTLETEFPQLPAEVVEECKRVLLDSLGCALAAVDEPKGRIGIQYGRLTGGVGGDATIIGTGDRVSIFGAAFANGELINAMDFDAVLPPGHVAPYVLPGALAVGESLGSSGKDLVTAIAVSHEMSYRFAKAMDYLRDTKDGKISLASVLGFSSTVFGATAAIGKLKGYSGSVLANALGIAGSISPVNTWRSLLAHAPSSTIKYTMAGVVAQTALTAAYMAELGHRGDLQVLDDAEFGYRRFIGSSRWEPDSITKNLGADWWFPAEHSYKPYPHCRVLHAPLDGLIQLVEENDIKPEEIDAIHAWGEAWIEQPIWLNKTIEHVHDAQFSVAHGLSVGAHRITPGRAWQDPDLVFSRSVLDLMDKVTFAPHPDYVAAITKHPASRPSRIEVVARGTTYVAERNYPKGSPSPDPATTMTTDELVAKFRHNAEGVITPPQADAVVHEVLNLETVENIGTLMRQLSGADRKLETIRAY
jgi:2-methylcitrate dehydratase PrpD